MSEDIVLPEGMEVSNRYRVLELIGGGAMARVYKIRHLQNGTLHAMKVQTDMKTGENSSPEAAIVMARREAQFLNELRHRYLPEVSDLFREDGRVHLVMEYIEGQNLRRVLEDSSYKALETRSVLKWALQICEVLTYLHDRDKPIIFRDIKPSNIMLRPNDTICLVDFGIARYVRDGASADTMVLGSPGYAPPEQYGHDQTTPLSDIYALGATLHHLLTGRDPSTAPFKWPSVRSLNPSVPLVLEKIVMRCLDINPAKRPESAEALATSLRSVEKMLKEANGGTGPLDIQARLRPIMDTHRATGELDKRRVTGELTDPAKVEFLERAARADAEQRSQSDASRVLRPADAPTLMMDKEEAPRIAEAAKRAPAAPPRPYQQPPPPLFASLRLYAAFLLVGCLGLLLVQRVLEPVIPPTPAPLAANATVEEQIAYPEKKAEQMLERERMETITNTYRRMGTVRVCFITGILFSLGYGVFYLKRPTKLGLALVSLTALLLVALASVTFMPLHPAAFFVVLLLAVVLFLLGREVQKKMTNLPY